MYPALALDAAFSSHTGAYALDPIPTLRDSNDLKDGALAPYLEMIEEGLTRSASPLSTLHPPLSTRTHHAYAYTTFLDHRPSAPDHLQVIAGGTSRDKWDAERILPIRRRVATKTHDGQVGRSGAVQVRG